MNSILEPALNTPVVGEVDVSGVQRLPLMALRSAPQGWLQGPICWGEPTLTR
jgi:hypothetical protein